MHLRKTFLLVLLCSYSLLQAQDKLVVQGAKDNFFVVHEVTEKESLSSIGRIYGFTAKQLAQYNDINVNAVLALGTKLKVQLTPDNFSGQANLETSIALYHISKRGDNLYQLSQLYNKVPVATLRKWNDLSSDNVRDGQAIIIGFINGPKTQSTSKAFKAYSFLIFSCDAAYKSNSLSVNGFNSPFNSLAPSIFASSIL